MKYWQRRNIKTQQALFDETSQSLLKKEIALYRRAYKATIDEYESTYNKILAQKKADEEVLPTHIYNCDKYYEQQKHLKERLRALGDTQIESMSSKFEQQYKETYESLEVPTNDSSFKKIDDRIVTDIIQNMEMNGQHFSQRVWNNLSKLAVTLDETFYHCLMTGKSTKELKEYLVNNFNVSLSQAATLIRTETANIMNQSSVKRYADSGIQWVEWYTCKDERRCDTCKDLHGKKFPVNNCQTVAHPNCRCCYLPVIEGVG